jgi:hypothetical protein
VGRIGLYPVVSGVTELSCPEQDVEAETGQRAAEFARIDLPTGMPRQWNQIGIGFHNAANCPFHGYWIPHPTDAPINPTTSCPTEEFKLHLGLQAVKPNFHRDWQSNTKFEGSAIGHSFAFRLASNPSILVETVTLATTKVIDCPDRQQETTEIQIITDRVILPDRFRQGQTLLE